MRLIVPEYFTKFSCIADRCSDSCCIGWEIGIDTETLGKYSRVGGELGEELREKICKGEDGAHFELDSERCPFLDSRGLCRLITNLGEGYLCEICREHPRYYSVFEDFASGGIALACEEAARLILSERGTHEYDEIEAEGFSPSECDGELLGLVLSGKKKMLSIIADGEKKIGERLSRMLDFARELQAEIDGEICEREAEDGRGCDDPFPANFAAYFADMEHLNGELSGLFGTAAEVESGKRGDKERRDFENRKNAPGEAAERYLENVCVYFLDRYLLDSAFDGRFFGRVYLAALSTVALTHLFAAEENLTLRRAVEIVKCYSKEIEYSEENVERIIADGEDRGRR